MYIGRLDDIVVLSNGEKFNPVSMEGAITSGSPDVKRCLVFGQGKFHGGLLVEATRPPSNREEEREMKDRLWPVIQQANKDSIGPGKISKDFILFTSVEKPLLRAGKGTIQRQLSLSLYQAEIEQLYCNEDNNSSNNNNRMIISGDFDMSTLETLEASMLAYITSEVGVEVTAEDDISRYGLDSLQTMTLVRAINGSLGRDVLVAKQVYDNPTIKQLAQVVHLGQTIRANDDDDRVTWVLMQQVYEELKLGGGIPEDEIVLYSTS